MSRTLGFVLVALVLAGCASAPAAPSTNTTTTAGGMTAPLPFHAAGRLWLPEQTGQAPARVNVSFPVNGSSFQVAAHVKVSASLGAADAPSTASTVAMTLVDPTGRVLAKAEHGPGPATTHDLNATAAAPGTYALVFECQLTGGGAGTGDYADYDIKAS